MSLRYTRMKTKEYAQLACYFLIGAVIGGIGSLLLMGFVFSPDETLTSGNGPINYKAIT